MAIAPVRGAGGDVDLSVERHTPVGRAAIERGFSPDALCLIR